MKSLILNILVGLLFFSMPFISYSQWEMAVGLDGGKIWKIANIDSILFASTEDHGVFINKNGSWELAHQDVAFDEIVTAGNYAFIYGYLYNNEECLRSFDQGESWESVLNLDSLSQLKSIDTVLFFKKYSNSNLLRSFDYGETYDTVQSPIPELISMYYCDDSLLIIHPSNSHSIHKIYYSDNFGYSWDSLSVEGLFNNPGTYASKIKYLNGTFWAIKNFDGVPISYQEIFVYLASSAKWVDVTADMPNRQFYNDIIDYNDNILCSHDLYSVLKFVEEDSSWVEFANGSKNVNQFLRIEDELYCATDQGPYSLDAYGSWTAHTAGLNHRNVTSMDIYNGNIYLTANNELFYSTDDGNSFEIIADVYGKQIITTDSIFYLISTNRFSMSRDEGDTWQSYTEGIVDVEYQRFSHFSISPHYYYLGTWENLYRTPTASIEWTPLDTWPWEDIAKVESIGNTVIFGEDYFSGVLLFSNDFGNTSSAFGSYCQFSQIDESYYLLRDSILFSNDPGHSWDYIPYPDYHTKDDIDRKQDTVIVIGYEFWGNLILQLTYNLGDQWIDVTDNLEVIPDVGPYYYKFVKIHKGRIFMSSENGLWYRDDLIVSIPKSLSPEKEKPLINVYPVPAKDELFVDFVICKNEPIICSIINLNGTQLYYDQFTCINNIESLNVSHLSKGVYFLRIITKDHSFVKKFIKL